TLECETGLEEVFDDTVNFKNRQPSITRLTVFLQTQSDPQTHATVRLALARFDPLVVQVEAFSQRAYEWRRNYDEVWADINPQRTMNQVRNLILDMRVAVETFE